MIIFGGCGGNCAPALSDVWLLSNANGLGGTPTWTQVAATGPAGRTNGVMVYSAAKNELFIYGGQDGSSDPCSTLPDAWILFNANGLDTSGSSFWFGIENPDRSAPSNGATANYDPVTGALTIFGGMAKTNGICQPTNTLFESITPILSPVLFWQPIPSQGPTPPARAFGSAVHDSTGGRMFLFGGTDANGNALNDVWTLDTTGVPTWAQLNPTGGPPAARSASQAVFDPASQSMTIFGGSGGSGVLNDTWVLSAPGISGLSCTQIAGVPNLIRPEGITELLGDLALNCSGGVPTPSGQPIPQYTLSVSFNADITSRSVAGGQSEALAIIDDAYPATPSPAPPIGFHRGANQPLQILCMPLGSVCAETGTGGTPNPYQTQPNVFVGRQTGPTTLEFQIPLDAPGVDLFHTIRITNVRANAFGLFASPIPVNITASASFQGAEQIPVSQPPPVVAAITTSATTVSLDSAVSLSQCAPHNASLLGSAGPPAFDFNINVQETFASFFKYRNYGTTEFGPQFPPQLVEQNLPSFIYNVETAYYSPSLFTQTPTLGLADFGTRIRVEFRGVTAGTHLFVPTTIDLQVICTPGFCDPAIGKLQLIHADENGISVPGYEPVAATAMVGTTPVAEVNYAGSNAYAIYEVVGADPFQMEKATIPVAVAFSSPVPASGAVTASAALAPISAVTTADASAPLPRFGDVSTPSSAYTIQSCAACSYTLAPSGISLPASGGSGSFTITPSQGCSLVAPQSLASFVSFNIAGSTVNYTVGPNTSLQARTATITVASQSFTISQAGATLLFTPSRLFFMSSPNAAPPAQTVNVSGLPGSFSVSSDASWATVTSSSTQLPATLTVTVNPAGLQAGIYAAALTINVNGTPFPYSIQYQVQALPSLVPIPAKLTFNYAGGAAPAGQQLEIYSTSPVAFQAAGSGFVSVTPSNGTTTQKITVSVDPSGLAAGTHTANVTVTASGVANSPLVVPVTFNVTSTGPQVVTVNIVNAASYQTGSLAPGGLFTVFGSGFTTSQSAARSAAAVQGVSMTLGGIAVPLLYVSPTQINAQIPYEVVPGQQPLVMNFNGVSTTVHVPIVPAAPGIFLVNGSGAILNQDSSLNGPNNPAQSGSILQVFFTGQGKVSPAAPTGAPASTSTLSFTDAITTATIGTKPAKVVFSGLAPGMIGLAQANVQAPSLPTGHYPFVITIDGIESNSVTVALKSP